MPITHPTIITPDSFALPYLPSETHTWLVSYQSPILHQTARGNHINHRSFIAIFKTTTYPPPSSIYSGRSLLFFENVDARTLQGISFLQTSLPLSLNPVRTPFSPLPLVAIPIATTPPLYSSWDDLIDYLARSKMYINWCKDRTIDESLSRCTFLLREQLETATL